MTYLLDTSIIIDLLRKKDKARDFIASHADDVLITSTICEAEIAVGVYREESSKVALRKEQAEKLFSSFYQVVTFDRGQAIIAGRFKAELSRVGYLIDDLDILIAAAATSYNATLVTSNPKHFERIKNLQLLTI